MTNQAPVPDPNAAGPPPVPTPLRSAPPRPPTRPAVQPAARPPRRFGAFQIVTLILLILSLLGNLVLLVITIGLVGLLGGGDMEDGFVERMVEKGPASAKIAIIHVDGLIDEALADRIRGEAKRAARDDHVKAVVLRINSPGGGLTASDMIYHDIHTLLAEKGKPVVASMDSVAASGGYYVACAADEIVAQRTTITGSIGVIAEFFFLQGLLQDKLGVKTVTLKMGEQKDWPNLFAGDMTEPQRQYLLDTLLVPGYDRFVTTVSESRQMKRGDVEKLATGRIFMAAEAKSCGLVDQIGYLDDAIDVAMKRAGIAEARVVEYVKPFRLSELFGLSAQAKTALDLRPERLAALATPKVMYLWTGY